MGFGATKLRIGELGHPKYGFKETGHRGNLGGQCCLKELAKA
jgi:hypothetical protein